ncbi:MAG TPA: type II toxin-antitoxin system Phd/YefM family antitoxin [Myxococcaceae bacterium]|nr:type II toxin-antitoxin system Phd/YefM family antitoxin [Myxococcaceae bacterium]
MAKRQRKVKNKGRRTLPASEFKARCLRVLDEVDSEGHEFVITKHGRPVARLCPVAPRSGKTLGRWSGLVEITGDIVHSDWSQEFEASRD